MNKNLKTLLAAFVVAALSLVSARAAAPAFDLGCKVREALFAFVAREYPNCLPQVRMASDQAGADQVQRVSAASQGLAG